MKPDPFILREELLRNPTLEGATAYYAELGLTQLYNDPTVPLAAVHKARLQWLNSTNAMLEESKCWLLANNYQITMGGLPPLTPESRDAQRKALGMGKLEP